MGGGLQPLRLLPAVLAVPEAFPGESRGLLW
jgi:hypothetical protein